MRWLLLALAVFLSGCGGGYAAPEAVLHLELPSVQDMDAAKETIARELEGMGFEASRTDPAILESLRAYPDLYWKFSQRIDFWQHRESGWLEHRDVYVTMSPYADASHGYCGFRRCGGDGTAVEGLTFPFIEFSISETRPGGFSADARAIYEQIVGLVGMQGGTVVIVHAPDTFDEAAHDQIVSARIVSGVVWWLAAWAIYMLILGGPLNLALAAVGAQRGVRRFTLLAFGTLAVTPIPISTGMFSIPVPNLFLLPGFPTAYEPYAEMFGPWLPAAFVMSAGLSILVSLCFVRVDPALRGR